MRASCVLQHKLQYATAAHQGTSSHNTHNTVPTIKTSICLNTCEQADFTNAAFTLDHASLVLHVSCIVAVTHGDKQGIV